MGEWKWGQPKQRIEEEATQRLNKVGLSKGIKGQFSDVASSVPGCRQRGQEREDAEKEHVIARGLGRREVWNKTRGDAAGGLQRKVVSKEVTD